MTTLTYPSEVNPGPPALALDVPDGWEQLAVPQTLLATREPATPDAFATNIVARLVQRGAGTTPDEVVGELGAHVRGKPDGEVGPPYAVELSGRTWTAVNLSYDDADHGVINQLHLFSGETRGPLLALVQVTATFAGSREEEQLGVVREVLSTLRVGRPGSA
jgi:hypothetical protein